MASTVSKTVSVVFSGDAGDLTKSMDDLGEEAKAAAQSIVDAFADIGEKISTEWDDLGEQLGKKLDSQGDAAGKTGVDSIVKQFSDLGGDISTEWDDLGTELGKKLDTESDAAGKVGVDTLVKQYADVGAKVGMSLSDFAEVVGKTLDTESDVAGKSAADAMTLPFKGAGAEAGESFAKGFKGSLVLDFTAEDFPTAGATEAGTKAGDKFGTAFDIAAGIDEKGDALFSGLGNGAAGAGTKAGTRFGAAFDLAAGTGERGDTLFASTGDGAEEEGAKAGAKFAAGFDGAANVGEKGDAVGALGGITEWAAPIIAAVGSVWETINLEDYEAKIQGALGATKGVVSQLINSWAGLVSNTEYSTNQMAEAFATVAGQYEALLGHVPDTAEFDALAKASANLAQATGGDLAGSMQAVVNVMQAWGPQAANAAKASAVLYNVAIETGNTVPGVAAALQKLHSQLGNLTPPLTQVGGLMLDLQQNGEVGKAGLTTLNTATTAMFKPTVALQTAQQNLIGAYNATFGPSRKLADEVKEGKITTQQYTTAVDALPKKQATLANSYADLYGKVITATQAVHDQGIKITTAKGQFVGWTSVIEQLDAKMKHETKSQQLATAAQVFGLKPAQKLLDVIKEGPAAYEKYTQQAGDATKETKAAGANADTVGGQIKVLEAKLVDLADEVGPVLIPFLQLAIKNFGLWVDVIGIVTKNIQQVTGYVEGFAKTVTSAFDSVKKDLSHLPASFVEAFQDPKTFFLDIGKELLGGLWTGIEDEVPKLLGDIPSIGGKILGGFKSIFHIGSPSDDTIEMGQFLLQGLNEGMQDSGEKSNILTSLTTLSNEMLTNLRGDIPAFTTVGEQLMEGLAEGIESAASQVASAAAAAATSALAAAKTATKTASPSQVFAELGANFMAGLAQGVTANAGLAKVAVTSAVTGIASVPSLAGHGGGGNVTMQFSGPVVAVQSPSGTLPASTLAQMGDVVQEGLKSFASSYMNALRVSGG